MKPVDYIAQGAMLFSYTIHEFGNTSSKWTPEARKALRNEMGDTSPLGTHSLPLFPSEQLADIRKAVREIRDYVNVSTLPWATHTRIIPKIQMMQFINGFNTRVEKFQQAVQDSAENYEAMLAVAEQVHKSMYRRDLYPETADDFKKCYSVDKQLATVTTSSQVWEALPQTMHDVVKREFDIDKTAQIDFMVKRSEAQIYRSFPAFHRAIKRRFKTPIWKIADKEVARLFMSYIAQYLELSHEDAELASYLTEDDHTMALNFDADALHMDAMDEFIANLIVWRTKYENPSS